jgi:hypothetical protein
MVFHFSETKRNERSRLAPVEVVETDSLDSSVFVSAVQMNAVLAQPTALAKCPLGPIIRFRKGKESPVTPEFCTSHMLRSLARIEATEKFPDQLLLLRVGKESEKSWIIISLGLNHLVPELKPVGYTRWVVRW